MLFLKRIDVLKVAAVAMSVFCVYKVSSVDQRLGQKERLDLEIKEMEFRLACLSEEMKELNAGVTSCLRQ